MTPFDRALAPPGRTLLRILGRGSSFQVGLLDGEQEVVRRPAPSGAEGAWLRHQAALRRLHSPRVGALRDRGRDGGGPWSIESRARGTSLRRLVEQRGAASPAAARALFKALVEAVAELEVQEVRHRDLNPDHVFLEGAVTAPRVELIDFGLAEVDGAPPLPRAAYGTVPFCPPERIRGEAFTGSRAEAYSVAACVYFALLGEEPGPVERAAGGARRLLLIGEAGLDRSRLRGQGDPVLERLLVDLLDPVPTARPELEQIRRACAAL